MNLSEIKIGSRFYNWEITSEPFKINKTTYVNCKCLCGSTKQVRFWHLTRGKTKSCGCVYNSSRFVFQGIGDLSLSYYNSFKRKRMRSFAFDDNVTMDFLWKLYLEQKGKCALSGIEIKLNRRWSDSSNKCTNLGLQTASIDRINSSKPYTIDNVQWVHKTINFMKGSLSDEDFIDFCKAVANNDR